MAINYSLKEQKRIACISNELARAGMMFKVSEFRLLFNVISLINPESEELPIYDFTYKEIAILTDTVKSKTGITEIRDMLFETIQKCIVLDKDKAKAFVPLSGYDSEDLSKIELVFHQKLKEHVLLIENIESENNEGEKVYEKRIKKHYAKIDMNIFNTLKSCNTMRLYIYLKSYQALRKTGFIPLDDIKFSFNVSPEMDIKTFNRVILNKSIKEINEKTDINVVMNKITKNKAIIGYDFTISSSALKNEVEESKETDNALEDSIKNEFNDDFNDENKGSLIANKDYSAFINIAKIGLGMKEKDIVKALISCGYDENKAYDKLSKSVTA